MGVAQTAAVDNIVERITCNRKDTGAAKSNTKIQYSRVSFTFIIRERECEGAAASGTPFASRAPRQTEILPAHTGHDLFHDRLYVLMNDGCLSVE